MTLAALDFWTTSGWHLLDRNADGLLVPSADFMRAYFHRPELALVEESCAAEKALRGKLAEDPFAAVGDGELSAMADPDIIGNYRAVLAFREFLGRHESIESAYMAVARGEEFAFPPLFIDQLCQMILRQILDGEIDALNLRAAEILFRTQVVTVGDGRIMVADQSTVQFQSGGEDAAQKREIQIDVLTADDADAYWERSELFDTAIDIAFDKDGAAALGRVLERWVAHFLRLDARITPLQRIDDDDWRWHVGLDSDSSAILDALYRREELDEGRLGQILCLFRLESDGGFIDRVAGKPVYLALCQNASGTVRAKPQNLLTNLPLGGN